MFRSLLEFGLTEIGCVGLLVWLMVAIPVGRMAYRKNVADPDHGTAVDVLLAVGKGIIWPPYLLFLWARKYVGENY